MQSVVPEGVASSISLTIRDLGSHYTSLPAPFPEAEVLHCNRKVSSDNLGRALAEATKKIICTRDHVVVRVDCGLPGHVRSRTATDRDRRRLPPRISSCSSVIRHCLIATHGAFRQPIASTRRAVQVLRIRVAEEAAPRAKGLMNLGLVHLDAQRLTGQDERPVR
jgi:hypothetical protein